MDKTKKLVLASLFTALSIVLLYIPFLRFPLFVAAPFLEYDAMDVPILFGSLMLDMKSGLIITLLSCFIQGITVSSSSGLYGIIMHFISTGAFVIGTRLVYGKNKEKSTSRLIISLICGVICMTLIMIPSNLFITPLFMGVSREVVFSMLLPVFIPFNALKSGINALVTFLLYVPIKRAVKF